MLLDFFNFFGNILDYNTTEISPNKANDKVDYPFPPKKSFLEYYQTTSLVINDPLTTVNNVARPTFKFFILRMIFSYAHLSVYQPCSCDMKIILNRLQTSLNGTEPESEKPKRLQTERMQHQEMNHRQGYYGNMDGGINTGGMIGCYNHDMTNSPERDIIENYYEEKYSIQKSVENLFLLKRIFNSHKNPIVTIYKTQSSQQKIG